MMLLFSSATAFTFGWKNSEIHSTELAGLG